MLMKLSVFGSSFTVKTEPLARSWFAQSMTHWMFSKLSVLVWYWCRKLHLLAVKK